MTIEIYFVKNGLLNGEPGTFARTAGFGIQQKDGWYYLPPNADDGEGPFLTRGEAEDAALVDRSTRWDL